MRTKAFSREAMAPVRGTMSVMQYCLPDQLEIDHRYQRSIDNPESQSLIADIALNWHWGRAQVLTVSRRDGRLFVVDGQHRLAAAKLRGDIQQLPCLVEEFADVAEEARLFGDLNGKRRPVSAVDKFRAGVMAGDADCIAIGAALERAGLALAPHSNPTHWKPGQLANVGGIQAAWKSQGPEATAMALGLLAQAFAGEVLTYAGTIFPGVVAVCAGNGTAGLIDEGTRDRLLAVLRSRSQADWRSAALVEMAQSGVGRVVAMTFTLRVALAAGVKVPASGDCAGHQVGAGDLAPVPYLGAKSVPLVGGGGGAAFGDGFEKRKAGAQFCDQCQKLVSAEKARTCRSAWCKLRDVPASSSAAVGGKGLAA